MRTKLIIGMALVGLTLSLPAYAATFKRITDKGDWGDYEAFPDVCKLANGDLIVGFYAGYGHAAMPRADLPKGGRICIMRSKDNGVTWSKPQTLVDLDGDDRDCSFMQTSTGTVICNFMKYYGRRGVPISHDVWVTRSSDNGQTWEEPKSVPSPLGSTTATSSPIIEIADGTLLMPIYGRDTEFRNAVDKPGKRDRTVIVRSTDDGKTWGEPVFIDKNPEYHLQEPSIIRLHSGKLLCVMRRVMTQSFSDDNGQTWSKPEKLPHRGDAPYLLQTREGVILCAHRYPGTSVTISTDGAETWSKPIRIDGCGGAYPSMVELDDGRILCIYYEEGTGSNIRQAIFRVKPGPTIELENQ